MVAHDQGDGSGSGSDGDVAEDRALVVVGPDDLDYVRALAGEQGLDVEVVEQEGFLPGVELLVVLAGAAGAVAFVLSALDRRKGGQVFDLRPGATRLAYRTPDVVYGLVVVIGVDGTVKVEVHQPKDMFASVIEAVQKVIADIASPVAEALAEAVRNVVGDAAEVEVVAAD